MRGKDLLGQLTSGETKIIFHFMEVAFSSSGRQKWVRYSDCHGAITPQWQKLASDGLFYDGDVLSFRQGKGAYAFDFEQSYHRARNKSGSSLLLRAMRGLDRQEVAVDTCCGQGDDLIELRTFFKRVVGIERHPLIYTLLCDAKRRFSLDGVDIQFGDSRYFPMPGKVFYMDPMFAPTQKKKSQAKGPMEFLKRTCGIDGDAQELLQVLIKKRPKRVVVKRPLKGPEFSGPRPKSTLKGKLIRFDIY